MTVNLTHIPGLSWNDKYMKYFYCFKKNGFFFNVFMCMYEIFPSLTNTSAGKKRFNTATREVKAEDASAPQAAPAKPSKSRFGRRTYN